MSAITDALQLGIDVLQFWTRFKGRRIRVWPSDCPVFYCTACGAKCLILPDGRRKSSWLSLMDGNPNASSNPLTRPATENLNDTGTPHIESVEQARLFDATISDILRLPAGLYLTKIEYWAVAEDKDARKVIKIRSRDKGLFLPFDKLARIDFLGPQHRWSARRRRGRN